MMPVYRYMDSDPYQRNQPSSFPQYHYPGFRANSPVPFEPWPCAGNYGYPMPCHSCCNHNNVPGYNAFRPSYPHASMPSPMHFCGGYPAPYHEPYQTVHYVPPPPPPPHYSMESPKYEYDKNMPLNYHCCGCPNHLFHQNVDKGMKIEEQGPDVGEKKKADSLGPVQMKNYPYPIVWIPPESIGSADRRKLSEPEIIEEKKIPSDSKPHESMKSQEGDQRHGWNPVDMNNIGYLKQGGNRERGQDQQTEEEKKEFPFPIFWMPSQVEVGKKDKNVNVSGDHHSEDKDKQFPFPFFWFPIENKQEEVGKGDSREVNATPKIVPMNIAERGDVTNETRVKEEEPAGQGVVERKDKTVNQKSIPVKQVDPIEENKSDGNERRGRSVSVKHGEDNVANKPCATNGRRHSSTPKKSSELPPICLRVDPLPRKKKTNGTSRSPSPPGPKGRKQDSSTDSTKASASLSLQENAQQDLKSQSSIPNNIKEVEPSKKVKVIEVVDRNVTGNGDVMRTLQASANSKEEVSRKPVGEAGKDGGKCEVNEDRGARKVGEITADTVERAEKCTETAKSVGGGSKLEKKSLSDVDAAVRIQSAYRGFEVRRWEPLKKLKQIAEIREQVADVRNRITFLETSDLQKDDKERVVIGETIMRLLLTLDTIQGLLPSLRDIRRSLARELVVLQERLDDIMAKKSQDPIQKASTVKPVEELSPNANNKNCMLEQKDEVTGLGQGPADGNSDSSHHATEPCQGQEVDSVPALRIEEADLSDHGELYKGSEDGDQELPVASGLKSEDLGLGPFMEPKDDVVTGQCNAGEMAVANTETGNGSTELDQCGEASSIVEDSMVSAGTSSEVGNMNPETKELEELPREVTDNKPVISEPEKDEQIEMSKDEVKQSLDVDFKMSPDDVTLPNVGANMTDKDAEMHEPAELPRVMIDEDSSVNEVKKTEEAELVKEDDVLQSGEQERQIAFDAALHRVETQNEDQLEPRPEGAMEEQPIVQSEEQLKVGSQMDEELRGDSVLKEEVELLPQKEVGKDDFILLASESIESQPLRLPVVQTEIHDVVHEDAPSDVIDNDGTCFSVLADIQKPNEEDIQIERGTEDFEYQPAATTVEVEKMQESKVECEDNNNGLATVAKTAEEDVFIETRSTPVQKSGSLPTKPIASQVSSIDGCVMGVETDTKLIEENEKLRAMMQKLMEAGSEQLQVISKLTGRVKDLEKKLARKKKVRTTRCRAASSPSGSSCVKPSNHPSEERGAGVAM